MKMVFDKHLQVQEIFAIGDEIARYLGEDKDNAGNRRFHFDDNEERHLVTLINPVLMTDIAKIARIPDNNDNTSIPSNYAIQRGIVGTILRDVIDKLIEIPRRIVVYDGVNMDFDQSKYNGKNPADSVWGPSIDTLFLCRALSMLELDNVKTAAEIGAGSGFISKYLVEKLPNLEKMVSVDRMPLAYQCMIEACKDKRWKPVADDGIEYLKGRKFDLVVCNPPYIRRPKSIDDNPYEGIGLLVDLIRNAKDYLTENGRLVLNISDLAGDIPDHAINNANADKASILTMDVPLRVFAVTNNPEWREYLLKNGLQRLYKEGHDYWHTLKALEIRP
ncbi:MAG: methyltransferase [Candidatus Woesearchaeota archaeon]